MAYLHKAEQVLNKDDTKNLFDTIKLTDGLIDKLQSFVKRIDFSKMVTQPNVAGLGDRYELNIHVDNLNGDKKSIDNLSTTIIDGLKKMGKKF